MGRNGALSGVNQIAQTDANGHTTTYRYDVMNRRISETLPDGTSTQSMTYDANGNLATQTDRNGHTTTFTYDVMNRVLSRTADSALNEAAVSFTYSATGQRLTMTDATGTTRFTYDAMDRLITKETPEGTLHYTYNDAGLISSLVSDHADGVHSSYTYDVMNRLVGVTDHTLSAGETAYTYNPNGTLAKMTAPNGVTTTYTYDVMNRIVDLKITRSDSADAAVLASYHYVYNAAGNRTSVQEGAARNVSYTYDNLDRLTSETITGDSAGPDGVISYSYDLVGNRLSRTSSVSGVSNQTQTFNADDQIVTSTENGVTVSYRHDANGNTLSDGRHTYTYDSQDRLMIEDAGAAGEVDIRYDGDGHKIAETGSGVTTDYLVDDLNTTGYPQTIEELQSGHVIRRYDWGLALVNETQQVTTNANWQSSFYGCDAHGSVRLLTDSSATVTDTSTYDAYGLTIASTGSTWNVYHFASQWRDPLIGNDFLNARWENVNNGAFFSTDTYFGRIMEPMTLHKRIYVNNNPMNRVDPFGHETITEMLSVVGMQNVLMGTLAITGVVAVRKMTGNTVLIATMTRELQGLIASGEETAMEAYATVASNTMVVAKAINVAAKAIGKTVQELSNTPMYPIIRRLGPDIFAFDTSALATHPWWFKLTYNGVGNLLTDENRLWVDKEYGWMTTMMPASAGYQLDEFPYACTRQGGKGLPVYGHALACPVPALQNSLQGGLLGAFCRWTLKGTSQPFVVVPIPL